MSHAALNHYVPQWYQRRFFQPGQPQKSFFYLDLSPEIISTPNNRRYTRNAIRRLGTEGCFAQRDLYTLTFGSQIADIVEREFFGSIDEAGKKAVEYFSDFEISDQMFTHFEWFRTYMSAQRFRTPKGLDWLGVRLKSTDQNDRLASMRMLFKAYETIWAEGVWEIVKCDSSDTKFILSDSPVTFYNRKGFPGKYPYPNDPEPELLGTQTLFPLSPTRCLIITNLGYVRNPRVNPLTTRINPRHFAGTVFDFTAIQTHRELPERDVKAINYILKKRAKRYIAAPVKEWLFPETQLRETLWSKLGDRFFLMPDPRLVGFVTNISGLFTGGERFALDEYGRRPHPSPDALRHREYEQRTFFKWQMEWLERFGPLDEEVVQKRQMFGHHVPPHFLMPPK